MARSTPTTDGLHKRIQIVEIIVVISLVLNVVTGFMTIHNAKQVNDVQNQVARP